MRTCTPSIDAGLRERRGDVVAVADEGERAAGERAETLLQRQHVGQRLARMFLVGQRVDDVQVAARGRRTLTSRACANVRTTAAVHPALEIARDVFDGLAAAERDVRRRFDDLAAELAHGDR